MSKSGISRRQFVTGAAITAAATAVPVLTNVAPAAATPEGTFPFVPAAWIPLDPTAAARYGLEIYRSKAGPGQGG